jgi:hypothetical protein
LDRDTLGTSGSPKITDTIFAKILVADVFVADVSIVNSSGPSRRTPNPNVLLELGFAISNLGWDRIVLVMNRHFGGPEELPFDLRGHRIATYALAPGDEKATQRSTLLSVFKAQVSASLGSSIPARCAGATTPLWWGEWKNVGSGAHGGNLQIREVGSLGFLFDLSVFNGAHSGWISGFAQFVGKDLARSRLLAPNMAQACDLTFRRQRSDRHREIEVLEEGDCQYFRGMRARFSGLFVHTPVLLFDRGLLDELDLARLSRITGNYYEALLLRMQDLGSSENLDSFMAEVIRGGVPGLYTSMEGIILRGHRGQLWAAYIDGEVVRYFTTEDHHSRELPKTIEHWRSRFADKQVVYPSGLGRTPKFMPDDD